MIKQNKNNQVQKIWGNKEYFVKVKNLLANNKGILAVCILLLVESFFAERSLFRFSNMTLIKWCVYFSAKVIIVAIGIFVCKLIESIYNSWNNSRTKVFTACFCIIFAAFIVYLFLCWPGLWCGDNHIIFVKAINFELYAVQSIITEMSYIVTMMLIPHPIAVVIFQFTIGALIGSYVIAFLYDLLKMRYVFLLTILFVSIPSAYFLLYTMRGGLFAYAILFLEIRFVELMITKKDTMIKELILLGVLGGGISAWRGEAIIFLIVFPIALICCWKGAKKKIIFYSTLSMLLVFSFIRATESYAWKEYTVGQAEKTYSLTPFVTGLSKIIVSDTIHSDDLQRDLSNIDRIISVNDLALHNSDLAPFNWQAEIGIRNDFTDIEYKEGIKSIINLIIRNFDVYFMSKLHLSMCSTGMAVTEGWLYPGFTEESTYGLLKSLDAEEYTSLFVPLNTTLRENVYNKMIGYYVAIPNARDAYYFIWALYIPIIILILTTILFAIQRKWILFWGNMFSLLEFGMTFLLCTGENVYYFITFYLTGWVSVILWINRKKFTNRGNSDATVFTK